MRYRNGEIMARDEIARGGLPKVDYVAGVPDSGVPHAMGYANHSGKPLARPFVKYTPTWPRSFMPEDQQVRSRVARMKQIPVPELIEGKKLLFVDDSIVRGTTSARIIKLLRDAGAAEVHFRSLRLPLSIRATSGTDIPDQKLLVATGRTLEQINEVIGADTLGYLSKRARCPACQKRKMRFLHCLLYRRVCRRAGKCAFLPIFTTSPERPSQGRQKVRRVRTWKRAILKATPQQAWTLPPVTALWS